MGYPQSPPELRQELIAEQFVRGQSDPELKKYLWVVIRTQKDKKLHTLRSELISLASWHPRNYTGLRNRHSEWRHTRRTRENWRTYSPWLTIPPWYNRRPPEPSTTPTLQQMFALACQIGYEMRPIAKQTDGNRPPPGNRSFSDQNRGFRPQARTNRDYSRIKCFSCGQFRHMRTRCTHPARPCRTNLWVGNSNPIIVNNGMAITNRETPHRAGPHPHRSTFASFEPHATSKSPHSPPDTSINTILHSRVHVQKHAPQPQIRIM